MIQSESRLLCSDNTGIKILRCIKVLGGSRKRYARIGDVIVCSVRQVISSSKFKKGEIVKAVIIRQKFPFKRSCGSILRSNDNAAVIVDNNLPVATRIYGVVFASQIIRKLYPKVMSLSTGGAV